MAIQDFVSNVRTAARLGAPSATVDSPRLDAGRIESLLASADLWLTSRAVSGFDEADFSFLPKNEREALTDAVHTFSNAAAETPSDGSAPKPVRDRAASAFGRILEIILPDKYQDSDALALGRQVEARLGSRLPAWVKDVRFHTGEDASGGRALWVWVVVDDDAIKPDMIGVNTALVRTMIDRAAGEVDETYWPYVRFQAVSEQLPAKTKPPAKRKKS